MKRQFWDRMDRLDMNYGFKSSTGCHAELILAEAGLRFAYIDCKGHFFGETKNQSRRWNLGLDLEPIPKG